MHKDSQFLSPTFVGSKLQYRGEMGQFCQMPFDSTSVVCSGCIDILSTAGNVVSFLVHLDETNSATDNGRETWSLLNTYTERQFWKLNFVAKTLLFSWLFFFPRATTSEKSHTSWGQVIHFSLKKCLVILIVGPDNVMENGTETVRWCSSYVMVKPQAGTTKTFAHTFSLLLTVLRSCSCLSANTWTLEATNYGLCFLSKPGFYLFTYSSEMVVPRSWFKLRVYVNLKLK